MSETKQVTVTPRSWTTAAKARLLAVTSDGGTIVAGESHLEISRSTDGSIAMGARPANGQAMGVAFEINEADAGVLIEALTIILSGEVPPAAEVAAAAPTAKKCDKCDTVHELGKGSPLLGC